MPILAEDRETLGITLGRIMGESMALNALIDGHQSNHEWLRTCLDHKVKGEADLLQTSIAINEQLNNARKLLHDVQSLLNAVWVKDKEAPDVW
jgi:hypothetical protein